MEYGIKYKYSHSLHKYIQIKTVENIYMRLIFVPIACRQQTFKLNPMLEKRKRSSKRYANLFAEYSL
jgi:hypothetical protein